MLTRPITYEDFNGNTVTEDFYFNLTRVEVIDINVSEKGGLEDLLVEIGRAKDIKHAFDLIQRIILRAYGLKSEDGRGFSKSDEISKTFQDSAAYDQLIWELLTDVDKAAVFIKEILPKAMQEEIDKLDVQTKVANVFTSPPSPPTPPQPPLPPSA
jgi:hypothetical protein